MKKTPLTPATTVIAFFLLCFTQTSLAQISDSTQQTDLCALLKRVKTFTAPFRIDGFDKYDSISNTAALVNAIKKATHLPFSEGECVSGEDDERLFAEDFDTLGHPVYQIIRVANPKGTINNSWTFLINTYNAHVWLITFSHTGNNTNCILAKNAVLIQFHAGANKHWYHMRSSEFKTPTTIAMSGECWFEGDAPDVKNGLAETLVIQKDGRITVSKPKKKK